MTKTELVTFLIEKTDLNRSSAEKALNALLEGIETTLVKEGKLTLAGFGTFVVEERKARKGRNPRTGEEMDIPASNVVKFRPGKQLKDAVK